ncbi:large ribosomal subunit protein bL17m-like [Prorops nasuta]|uniref:large ribosomal subunit protein bL17m-like n=1 Tax=Prorops nasuta TaxID=863751 RepID=UPI0034CE1777
MNQANVEKLISKLKFTSKTKPYKLSNQDGPEGRLCKISKTLTALLKHERIEANYNRVDETKEYVELLISEAMRYGPEHKETMDLANFWIREKQLVHKLFKVLVPRYQDYATSYTSLFCVPSLNPGFGIKRGILELKGNIYPSLNQYNPHEYNMLHNILLSAAKRGYRMEKYKECTNISSNFVNINKCT